MNRRKLLRIAGGSVAAGAVGMLGEKSAARAQTYSNATRGLPPLKITKVKTIQTCPQGGNYVVVKVETSEPGLYGVGSATLTTRGAAGVTAVQKFTASPAFACGPAHIEDLGSTRHVMSSLCNDAV